MILNAMKVLSGSNGLLEYIKNVKAKGRHEYLATLAYSLLEFFKKNRGVERVQVPLLKVLSQLLSYGCFETLQPPE
jgi:hypothetical protein